MSMILSALLLVVIVVVMGSMVYAWSTGLMGGMMKSPSNTGEALSLDNGIITNTTSATLYLRNIGDSIISASSIYISGSGGAAGTANATVTSFPVNQVTQTVITPNGGLTFQQGYTYEFKIVTPTGSQFVFNVKY